VNAIGHSTCDRGHMVTALHSKEIRLTTHPCDHEAIVTAPVTKRRTETRAGRGSCLACSRRLAALAARATVPSVPSGAGRRKRPRCGRFAPHESGSVPEQTGTAEQWAARQGGLRKRTGQGRPYSLCPPRCQPADRPESLQTLVCNSSIETSRRGARIHTGSPLHCRALR
jgi:hypothetical protein